MRNPLTGDLGHIAFLQAYLLELRMRQLLRAATGLGAANAGALLEHFQEGSVRLWIADRAGKWQRTCQQPLPYSETLPYS